MQSHIGLRFLQLGRRFNSVKTGISPLNAGTKKFVSADLYKTPSKWEGLSTEQLINLHAERKARLGHLYKPTQEEYKALLPSAKDLGIAENEFNRYYYAGPGQIEQELGMQNKSNRDSTLEPYNFDDLPSQAQILVGQHREQRFYNRLAAYDLPLLAQYRQEYQRPDTKSHPVIYRYTSYIGEEHPNARKVVLTLKTSNLGLNDKELHKLRLLAKTRYDHTTDMLRMSCELYEEPAQNARYLSTVLQRLLKEAKDMSDDFSDIPLDTRHTIAKNMRKKKRNYEFPPEWKRPQDAPKKTVNVIDIIRESL